MSQSSGSIRPIPPAQFYGPPPPKPPAQPTQDTLPPRPLPRNGPSPVRFSASGFNPYTSMHFLQDKRDRQMEVECRGKFVGPIPPANFLREFLPDSVLKEQIETPFTFTKDSKDHFRMAQKCNSEVAMYPHLINALKDYCPALDIQDTHNNNQTSEWARNKAVLKPDITAYESNASLAECMDMTRAEITVEVKIDPNDDPFVDEKTGGKNSQGQSPHERSTILGGDVRGQIITYATAQLAAQYRTHAFSVIIVDGGARLIRWDRAGAIFTKKFDYRKSQYLAEFFYRYNHATRAARGHDESVTMEHGLDDEVVMEARKALGCSPNDSLYRFEVVDEVTGEKTYYLGNAPSFKGNKSLTGRSTRGIVVYDIKNRKVAYLKDTWRVCGTGYDIDKEGDTYRKLKAAGVRNVPTVVTFGDVGDERWHRTQTDIFARKKGSPIRQLRGHRHCRLVFREVGRDLTSFETTGEIVGAIADAVVAHQDAHDLAGILHRDISVGNILITDNGGGLLIDWDLSKEVEKMGVPRQMERTGTWQFMSAKLLMTPTPDTHELADDLESFYHVLTWVTLRYTPHELKDGDLVELIYRYFDDSWYDASSGKTSGGQLKRAYLTERKMRYAQLPEGELARLIDDLATLLRTRYEDPPTEDELEQYKLTVNALKIVYKDEQALERVLMGQPVWKYENNMERLQTSDWIRNRFRQSADRRHLMRDTKTRNRDLGPPGTTSMRRPKESEAYTNQPKQPRKYGFKSAEGTEETPSALGELPDPKRPRQLSDNSSEDGEEATWAPGAPDIVDGRLVFSRQAGYTPEEILEDEGYDSAWEHERDETELDVGEEDETAEPL